MWPRLGIQDDPTFSGSVCKRVVVYGASLDVERWYLNSAWICMYMLCMAYEKLCHYFFKNCTYRLRPNNMYRRTRGDSLRKNKSKIWNKMFSKLSLRDSRVWKFIKYTWTRLIRLNNRQEVILRVEISRKCGIKFLLKTRKWSLKLSNWIFLKTKL